MHYNYYKGGGVAGAAPLPMPCEIRMGEGAGGAECIKEGEPRLDDGGSCNTGEVAMPMAMPPPLLLWPVAAAAAAAAAALALAAAALVAATMDAAVSYSTMSPSLYGRGSGLGVSAVADGGGARKLVGVVIDSSSLPPSRLPLREPPTPTKAVGDSRPSRLVRPSRLYRPSRPSRPSRLSRLSRLSRRRKALDSGPSAPTSLVASADANAANAGGRW